MGRTSDTAAAAANVMKLDPTWTAERYLSQAGGYAEKEAELFVNGARKAGLLDCVPADKLENMSNLDPRQVLRPATRQDVWVTYPLSAQFGAMSAHRQADGRRLHVSQSNVGNWPGTVDLRSFYPRQLIEPKQTRAATGSGSRC